MEFPFRKCIFDLSYSLRLYCLDTIFIIELQHAALSISNNIAEGFERETKKELIRFLYFSKGSAGECRNMFNFLQLIEYITSDISYSFRNDVLEISQQLGNNIKYLKNLEKQDKVNQKNQKE